MGHLFLRVLALNLFVATWAFGQAYQSTVLSLEPSHYWQLNETTDGEAVDSVGGLNGIHAGVPGGTGAPGGDGFFGPGIDDSGAGSALIGLGDDNRAYWPDNISSIDLGPGSALADSTMTVSAWFTQNGSQGGDRLWTNNQNNRNTSFQIAFGGGANLVIGLNPGQNGFPGGGLPSGSNVGNFQIPAATLAVKDGEWHHIVASRNGNNIEDVIVVVDGVHYGPDTWTDSTDTWGTTGSNAHIATRTPGDGGTAQQVLNGRVDEVAVWLGRQLTVEESIRLYDSAFSDEVVAPPGPVCDSDGDGVCDLTDIDALYDGIGSAGAFDFDGNGTVGAEDIGGWLEAANVTMGDLDLQDGVNSTDLGLLLNNFGSSEGSASAGVGYGGGDLNGDGDVDSTDLGLLLNNFGTPAAASASAVPEPSSLAMVLAAFVGMLGMLRRR